MSKREREAPTELSKDQLLLKVLDQAFTDGVRVTTQEEAIAYLRNWFETNGYVKVKQNKFTDSP